MKMKIKSLHFTICQRYSTMLFVKNSEITTSQIGKLRQKNPNYEPDKRFPLNLTVVHVSSETYAQLAINWNLSEVSCSNYESLKNNLLVPIVDHMINSVKKLMNPQMANEIGFKLIFYFPNGTQAASMAFWNGTLLETAFWSNQQENVTALGTTFSLAHVKATLPILLDNNYMLQREKNCLRCGMLKTVNMNTNISSPNNSLMMVNTNPQQQNPWAGNNNGMIPNANATPQNAWNSSPNGSLANVNWGSSWTTQNNAPTSAISTTSSVSSNSMIPSLSQASTWGSEFTSFGGMGTFGTNNTQPTLQTQQTQQTQMQPSLFGLMQTQQPQQPQQPQTYNGFGSNQTQNLNQNQLNTGPMYTTGFGFQ
jgi:hypothetical protein